MTWKAVTCCLSFANTNLCHATNYVLYSSSVSHLGCAKLSCAKLSCAKLSSVCLHINDGVFTHVGNYVVGCHDGAV